jgi:hypothetical protein
VTREEIFGLEFDWFAIDGDGLLALCSSAGYGEIPAEVLHACTTKEQPDRHIAELIARLPERGRYATEGRGPGWCEEWKQLGHRGLFVYDWRHWQGPYERIVVPDTPVKAEAVPAELIELLRPITLHQVRFANCPSFQVLGG